VKSFSVKTFTITITCAFESKLNQDTKLLLGMSRSCGVVVQHADDGYSVFSIPFCCRMYRLTTMLSVTDARIDGRQYMMPIN